MKLDVFSLIVLLGALQALFFGIFLFFTKAANTLQIRTLAFFILIFSYNGFETLGWSSELGHYTAFFNFFPFVCIFGLGPSLYLYVRSFQSSPVHKPWRHYRIVLLMFLIRACILLFWFTSPGHRDVVIKADSWYGRIAEPLSVLYFIVYYLLALRVYRQLMPANVQNGTWVPEEATLIIRWLRTLLMLTGIIGLTWFLTISLPYVIDLGGEEPYYVIEIMLVAFIYWIGFAGYQRTKVIHIAQQQKTKSYFDSLDTDEVSSTLGALEKAMEQDKLYLYPDLNITTLSTRLGIPAKTLSAVLNQRLNKGFNEYVNTYRVEAVKKMILDPANDHLTISGVAYECGFNSQPTFQRAFKAATGMTPKEFQSKQG